MVTDEQKPRGGTEGLAAARFSVSTWLFPLSFIVPNELHAQASNPGARTHALPMTALRAGSVCQLGW